MATLILGSVGRALGGPLGGIFGGLLGSAFDRALSGGGKGGARLANLGVQSSAYGEPLPRIFGTMRVAGNLVWTAGLAEHAVAGGYIYTASFAVLLSARPAVGVARIWADGKLLRDADGEWLAPVTMRLHTGGEGQAVDPLIAAAEGAGGTPAYRGLAYAVFEDLPLADHGNRIPNLTFELVADAQLDAGVVVADLCGDGVMLAGEFGAMGGFAAARGGDIRGQIEALAEVFDLRFVDDGETLVVRAGPAPGVVELAADDLGSVAEGASPHEARSELRGAAGQVADAVAIGFYDDARDYQPGLQRVVRGAGATHTLAVDVPMALGAVAAKGLAAQVLARAVAARTTATLRLPPRALGLRAGMQVMRPGDTGVWDIRRWGFSGHVAELSVERRPTRRALPASADAGRVHDSDDRAPGVTLLEVFELPAMSERPAGVWAAAAGASPGWRRSGVAISSDGGDSYVPLGRITAASTMGVLGEPLGDGGEIVVTLLNEAMWFDGDAVLLVGDEIIACTDAVALGERRFRLSGLRRGRYGTAVAGHPAGTRAIRLDSSRLLAVGGTEMTGPGYRFRATGGGDLQTSPILPKFCRDRPVVAPASTNANALVAL